MALWGKRDQSSDTPKIVAKAETGESCADVYGNTDPVGVFGVDAAEATAYGKGVTPGWVKRTVGSGGRAGRVTNETLVAMSSQGAMTDASGNVVDATDFANTATTDVANTTGTADDGVFTP